MRLYLNESWQNQLAEGNTENPHAQLRAHYVKVPPVVGCAKHPEPLQEPTVCERNATGHHGVLNESVGLEVRRAL